MRASAAVFLVLVACGAPPRALASPEAMRRERVAYGYAHCLHVCEGRMDLPEDYCCVADDGLTWSICAWNSCGVVAECRARHTFALSGGCGGGHGWPDCAPGRSR
ncbi:MAG TPA: hypothetical protein VMR29_09950 [Candidatus Binatia bacterium]|nr:hypothetical protein [Candidatus Binatia bacterium]